MPGYTHERNWGCRVCDEWTYKGMRACVLENELLRITVLVDKGTDIIEFLYKPRDIDFMWRTPMGWRNPATFTPTVASAAGSFLDLYGGGWQECFPAGGGPCTSKGAEFGVHGEVALLPWHGKIVKDTPEEIAAKFWVRTVRTPFYLEKTLSLKANSPVLTLAERVVNEGEEEMELMWGHHPVFGVPLLSDKCRVDAPAKTVEVQSPPQDPNSRLPEGQRFSWPNCKTVDGKDVDISIIPGPDTGSHDLAFLMDFEDGWYALTNSEKKVGVGMRWDIEVMPYCWFWMMYGGGHGYPWYGRCYNVALEPWTSYPGVNFTRAQELGTTVKMGAGDELATTLYAFGYEGVSKVSSVDEDCGVHE
jgi:hypothetical protein